MKKLITLLSFLLPAVFTFAQVDKENVLLEIATGTWCYYCPGAAMGADDLIANGHDVAVIENHNGDSYANAYSNARNSYYNPSGIPSANFDGIIVHTGGNHTQSLYQTYLTKYNQRINVPSDFTISVDATTSGFVDFDAVFDIEKVNGTHGDIRFHVAITESEIQENWQGMTHLNFVNRLMVPDQNGTTLDFSSNNSYQVELSFSLNSTWVTEHCELVAFLQNHQTKEVFQTIKVSIIELGQNFDHDAAIEEVLVPQYVCSESIAPKIMLSNYGNETLINTDIIYSINGGEEYTYSWEGSLEEDEGEYVELPEISFNLQADNTIMVKAENPNGVEDEYPDNNVFNTVFFMASNLSTNVKLKMYLDNHPEDITWELKNSLGSVLYSGGPYTQTGGTIEEIFDLAFHDCYSFFIYDAAGNGLTSPAYYKLMDVNENIIIENSDFGAEEETQFYKGLMDTNDHYSINGFNTYPNPFKDRLNIELQLKQDSFVKIRLINALGETVYVNSQDFNAGITELNINTSEFKAGVYFTLIEMDNENFQQKLILTK